MAAISGILLAAGLIAGCDPDEIPEPYSGVAGRGGSCEAQLDCFECAGCRLRWNEVCVSETCWLAGEPGPDGEEGDPLYGSYTLRVTIPKDVDPPSVRSMAIRVLHPRRTEGDLVTCEDLLADLEGMDDDPALNRLRTLEPQVILQLGVDVATLGANRIPAGPDRLFVVRLHPQPNGRGAALAAGCVEEVEVLEGDGQSVVIEPEILD